MSAGVVAAVQQVKPAAAEIDLLIRDVLSDRLTSDGFPDIDVAGGRNAERYNVRADLPDLKMTLTAAALPDLPGVEFTLLSLAEAQELAERTGNRVPFLNIAVLSFSPTEAIALLGGDYVAPYDPNIIKLCCCASRFRFTREGDRWRFAGTAGRICG